MLISELARRSGVSVASIKFYIREELLPAGRTTSRTRAEYDEHHLARLRLIRSLLDIGRLSVAAARSVIAVIDEGSASPDAMVRAALWAAIPSTGDADDPDLAAAWNDVNVLLTGLGWRPDTDSPALGLLAFALKELRSIYGPAPAELIIPYAEAARRLAADELAIQPQTADRDALVEWAVTGTVLFEQVFAACRRLAHEDIGRSQGE